MSELGKPANHQPAIARDVGIAGVAEEGAEGGHAVAGFEYGAPAPKILEYVGAPHQNPPSCRIKRKLLTAPALWTAMDHPRGSHQPR